MKSLENTPDELNQSFTKAYKEIIVADILDLEKLIVDFNKKLKL